jgi:sugar phosphate permease
MYIVASGVLGSLAFVTFGLFGGFVAVAGAVFLLSLSVSFGSNSQSSYILNLNVTKELGPGKAMGIYNSASRIGRVLGPMTLGWAIITLGTEKGLIYFGFIYLFVTALFLLFTQSDRKLAVKEESKM